MKSAVAAITDLFSEQADIFEKKWLQKVENSFTVFHYECMEHKPI